MPSKGLHYLQTMNSFGFASAVHSLQVGWYNNQVQDVFALPYPDDALAFIIISVPSMFEKCFLPFLRSSEQPLCAVRDPIDQCIASKVESLRQVFPEHELDIMHDYEMDHNRRPRVLVQTAGHLAGAAYYYQRQDVDNQPWTPRQKIFGVSMHPKYGGWFGLRSVVVFKDVLSPELKQLTPANCVPTDELKIELLEKFNYSWQDWGYRDVIPVEERYSEQQKLYFATLPKERAKLLEQLKEGTPIDTQSCLDQGHAIS